MSFAVIGDAPSTAAPSAAAEALRTANRRRPAARLSAYFRWSARLGRVAAVLLLGVAAPVILLMVVLVKLTSPGPGIYRQTRVGRRGRHFTIYKIRTMRLDAESKTGPVWSNGNDARITRVGSLLRWLHFDEFPQLWNVVRGEMSLIGPRPERPEIMATLSREIPDYQERLAVRPGITGLAQINLPPDSDLDSVRKKLLIDLAYIQEANWFLDLRIVLCTLIRLCGLPGDGPARLLKLRRRVVLPGRSRCEAAAEPVPLADRKQPVHLAP